MEVLGIKIGKLISFAKKSVSTSPNSAGISGDGNVLSNVGNSHTVVNPPSRLSNAVHAPYALTNQICPHVKPDSLLDWSPISSIVAIGSGIHQCSVCGWLWDVGHIDMPISAVRAKYTAAASSPDGTPRAEIVTFWSAKRMV